MILRRLAFAGLAAHLLLACGGEAAQSAAGPAGGAGGTASTTGGSVGSAGHASGGTSASAGAGGQTVQCDEFPVCPLGERTAPGSECPGAPSCHPRSVCGNTIWCVTGGGGGAGGAGGTTRDCNGSKCTATQACIAYRTEGGVALFADAGTCPAAEHLEGTMCARDFVYKCAELHGLCANQPVTCACAEPTTNSAGVCPAGYNSCSEPGPTEDTVAQLFCEQRVP